MQLLRTPDERFENLPDFPFVPNYAHVNDPDGGEVRAHYLDEGPRDAAPVVLCHGEPSWSFLYRHMVPVLVERGHRVVAPDLVGFGRSDKPADRAEHTYARHVEWLRELLFDRLDLDGVTVFGQDWGGLIALRVLAEHPERFARAVMGNTGLPTGDHRMPAAFLAWQEYSQTVPELELGRIVDGGCVSALPPEVVDAYDAPFPDDTFKEGPRIFPSLVPTRPDDPAAPAQRAAWESLRRWSKPFLTAFSDSDPVTKGGDIPLQHAVPGAAGQPHVTLEGGGHFLQEDCGPRLAAIIADFIDATPTGGHK